MTALARSLSYKTAKFTKIIDYRLALTNLGLQVLITFYVLFALVRGKTYLQTEVPIGRVTNWGSATKDFERAQVANRLAQTRATTTLSGGNYTILPCANITGLKDYEYVYDSSWVYANTKCAYLTADEIIAKDVKGGLFVSTHATQTTTYREKMTGSACPATHNFTDATPTVVNVANVTGTNGVCYYSQSVDWLFIGAEHTSLGFAHEFETSSGKFKGMNPQTFVRRAGSDEDLLTIPAGSSISFTLKQLLDIAQIDLDARYENQPGGFASSERGAPGSVDANRGPMARLAGLRVNAKLMYFNYNLDGAIKSTGENVPYCILEIEPSLSWTSLGNLITYRPNRGDLDEPLRVADGQPEGYMMNMYRYGVHIDVSSSGMVGRFNYVYFINVLISGLVLLRVAGTICDLIAKYLLGTRSAIYSQYMLEDVSFEREAARYAVQGMMAVDAYHSADTSGGDGLDINEIKTLIIKAFNHTDGMSFAEKGAEGVVAHKNRLSEDECRWLASVVMSAGDAEATRRYNKGHPKMKYEELKEQTIGLDEWIDLITDSKMSTPLLKKIVKMDKQEMEDAKRMEKYLT